VLAPPAEVQAQLRPAEMQAGLPARLAATQAELLVRFARVATPARSLGLNPQPRMQDSSPKMALSLLQP
jgi:hypothetical protein